MRSWSSVRAAALVASLVALFGAPTTAKAQGSATIQGTVTDSVGRRPLPGIQVVIAGTTRGGLTDDAGRYTIRGVTPGQVTVRAQRLGFAASEQQITVAAGQTASVDFMLRAVATVLSEVVVTGYGSTSRAEVSSAVSQVSAEVIQNQPVAGVDAALQGWHVSPDNPGRLSAARALAAFAAAGQRDLRGWVQRYAEAALLVAAADLDEVDARAERQEKAELVVVGTALGDALFSGLRRAAQEHISAERYLAAQAPHPSNPRSTPEEKS